MSSNDRIATLGGVATGAGLLLAWSLYGPTGFFAGAVLAALLWIVCCLIVAANRLEAIAASLADLIAHASRIERFLAPPTDITRDDFDAYLAGKGA